MMTISFVSFSQKKTNGTIYMDHPAINVVNELTNAMVAGDEKKVSNLLTDDFKSYDGTSTKTNDKGADKKEFLEMVKAWHDQLDYYSITPWEGAYPDALEYKKDNDKNEVWVQTWDKLKGVHKATGVKVEMAMHRLFIVTKDNKIKMSIDYMNNNVTSEIGQSLSNRTNGTIYNHHENINSVRKMLYAFENKDYDKAYGFYDKDLRASDINALDNKMMSLTDLKSNDTAILKAFDLVGIDQVGYPDYMHYEMGDSGIVYSWWTYHLIRKSDKKAIEMPIHFQHTFNKEGKIIREIAYYNGGLFN